jgi:hypothetical protein
MGKGKAYTGLWWGNLRERHHLEDLGVDGRIILRCIFRNWDVRAGTGSSWLKIGTGGAHMRGISWLAENRLASQEGLCSVE